MAPTLLRVLEGHESPLGEANLTIRSKNAILDAVVKQSRTATPARSKTREGWPHAPARAWLAVASIALGSFILVTTELLPIALLTPISRDLNVSEGVAGLMVAIPAILAAITALVLTVASGRIDRRKLLIGFSLLLLASDLLGMLAPNFVVMILARGLLGVALGGFWSLAAALAPRLVHERFIGHATSLVLGGISVATVLAVPAGSFIGSIAGWREVFGITSILAAIVVVSQFVFVPKLPVAVATSIRTLPMLLRRPRMLVLIFSVVFVITGQFAAYTYVAPYLVGTVGLDASLASALLLGYGIAGVVGNFIGGIQADRRLKPTLIVVFGLGGASIIASQLLVASPIGTAIALVGWGLAFGAIPASMQAWTFNAAHGYPEAGSALLVTIIQSSIALGSALGGAWVDASGTSAAIWFGAALVVVAFIAVVFLARTKLPAGAGRAGSGGGGAAGGGAGGAGAGRAGSGGGSGEPALTGATS
ncbi:MAG: transporter [Leifsonia sp.]|nr:transporter [Leifsonia sp.]